MPKNKLFLGLILAFFACNTERQLTETPNTKVVSVFNWSDTAFIESADFFDIGYADSVHAGGDVQIKRVDSSRFIIFGGSLPYAPLRAFQGATYVDVMAFNAANGRKRVHIWVFDLRIRE